MASQFSAFLGVDPANVYLNTSGRSSLATILQGMGIGQGDEVILQAFNCVAVVNAIKWVGARPVFVDIEEGTLNLDVEDLARKITSATRAIVVQHTFGLPFKQWDKLRELIDKKGIYVIEDCAHALGARVNGQLVGALGDAAIFSFGRDKMISSVFGGALVLSPRLDRIVRDRLSGIFFHRPVAPRGWVFKQLLHPIITGLIIISYRWFGLGKLIHWGTSRMGLLSRATSRGEKLGQEKPGWVDCRYPGALARLACRQLEKLEGANQRRLQISQRYIEAGVVSAQSICPPSCSRVWLRFPVLVNDPLLYHTEFAKRGVVIGDWYDQVVGPKEVELSQTGYIAGMAPVAEQVSRQIINLPVYPRMSDEDVSRVINVYNWIKEST